MGAQEQSLVTLYKEAGIAVGDSMKKHASNPETMEAIGNAVILARLVGRVVGDALAGKFGRKI